MVIHTIEGVDYIHIIDFTKATHRQVTSARRLIEDGNSIRCLKALRIRSALYIPVTEVYGYPFYKDSKIYHFNKDGEKYLCEKCSFTNEYCEPRQEAEQIETPEVLE